MGAKEERKKEEERKKVSIHAPVMGAKKVAPVMRVSQCFNPRTRDGCETSASGKPILRGKFQSTHP